MSESRRSAYSDALSLLARRELSVAQLRDRLHDRQHDPDDIEDAATRLVASGALNDARVAAAYVRGALSVKGRGRLRIQRELQAMGIGRDVAAEALAEAFGDVDERSLIKKALDKKLRGGKKIESRQEYARLFQFLVRQGFTPASVIAVLRASRKGSDPLE
ncbi:MAG TPA: RecX family transcriptional regulator [Gemmatimonadales bacterium]